MIDRRGLLLGSLAAGAAAISPANAATRRARQILLGRKWTPAKLNPLRWYEFNDLTNVFQSSAGTGAVTAANDPIGFARNKGRGTNITQATAGSRPLLKTDLGYTSARFDGTDDHLFDTTPGLYNAGSAWAFISGRFNPAVACQLMGESTTVGDVPRYAPMLSDGTTASTMAVFLRTDANGVILSNVSILTSAFNNTDKVIGFVDTGSIITGYLNGVAGTPANYSRTTSLTLNRFAVSALVRSSLTSFFACDIQKIVAGTGALSATDRALLVTYLGAGVGLTL